MGETPICVLLDGKKALGDLEATYRVLVIHQGEIEHRGLRELRGSTTAKLAALWVAPFETFLFLDADTVVWGNVRQLADLARFDFVVDTPMERPRALASVMNPEAVSRHFPDFDAHRYLGRCFNSGAFFARRGVLELDRYLELARFSWRHQGVFIADQGLLNFMLFSGLDTEALRIDQRDIQALVADFGLDEFMQRFSFVDGEPEVIDAPAVIHWVGSPGKPTMRDVKGGFFVPMAFFRRQFRIARRDGGELRARDELRLRIEDTLCTDFRGSNVLGRLQNKRRRAARKRHQIVARVKTAIRARTPEWVIAKVRNRASPR